MVAEAKTDIISRLDPNANASKDADEVDVGEHLEFDVPQPPPITPVEPAQHPIRGKFDPNIDTEDFWGYTDH